MTASYNRGEVQACIAQAESGISKSRATHKRQLPQRIQYLGLGEASFRQIAHSLVAEISLALTISKARSSSLRKFDTRNRAPKSTTAHSHHIRRALRAARFARLQQPSQRGRENFEDPSVGILVDKGPIKVEDYECFAHFFDVWRCVWKQRKSRIHRSELSDRVTSLIRESLSLSTIFVEPYTPHPGRPTTM